MIEAFARICYAYITDGLMLDRKSDFVIGLKSKFSLNLVRQMGRRRMREIKREKKKSALAICTSLTRFH